MTSTSLEKRIKRHVLGKEHDHFAVCAPGLASVCDQELAAIDELQEAKRTVSDDGVSFRSRLTGCYEANLRCRTATRVLMRLHTFTSTTFSHFVQQCKHFSWELVLPSKVPLDIQVATHHCRLHHTEAIAERFVAALSETGCCFALPNGNVNETMRQRIFIRGVDDRFTVSIDSSGLPLYKRGLKTAVGKAPLRETIAAALLRLAGYDGTQFLLDPMCGSGTFSLEAAMMARNVPPGWKRSFAFMRWPGFRERQWAYLHRQAMNRIDIERPVFILAADNRREACDALSTVCKAHDFLKGIEVNHMDFFDMRAEAFAGSPGLVVLNPPYGIRLETDQNIVNFYREVTRKLMSDFTGWRLIWIAPTLPRIELLDKRTYRFRNGGLDLTAMIGQIR